MEDGRCDCCDAHGYVYEAKVVDEIPCPECGGTGVSPWWMPDAQCWAWEY